MMLISCTVSILHRTDLLFLLRTNSYSLLCDGCCSDAQICFFYVAIVTFNCCYLVNLSRLFPYTSKINFSVAVGAVFTKCGTVSWRMSNTTVATRVCVIPFLVRSILFDGNDVDGWCVSFICDIFQLLFARF